MRESWMFAVAWLTLGCGAATVGATSSGAAPGAGEPPAEASSDAPAPRTHVMTFAGPSMEPLLADGEELTLVEANSFERGEVVVLLDQGGDPVAKRIVAIAGDVVALVQDVLQLNGEPVPRREIGPAQNTDRDMVCYEERIPGVPAHLILHDGAHVPESFGPVTVPPDHVFVLGDNRDQSNDSRYMLGVVPLARVAGRVVVNRPDSESRLSCPTE